MTNTFTFTLNLSFVPSLSSVPSTANGKTVPIYKFGVKRETRFFIQKMLDMVV